MVLAETARDMKDTDSAGSPKRETVESKTVAGTRDGNAHPAPFSIRKRIGSTAYEVEVHFSHNSGETLDDKILRLVRGGMMKGKDGEK
jgi:hypothetical protein